MYYCEDPCKLKQAELQKYLQTVNVACEGIDIKCFKEWAAQRSLLAFP